MADKKRKLVYSTRSGDQRQPAPPARKARSLPPAQQNLTVRREKKGRRGKTVTVISGFSLSDADLAALSKTLKTLCGAGGTAKEGEIEVQGDHREKVAEKLRELGYKVKLSGG